MEFIRRVLQWKSSQYQPKSRSLWLHNRRRRKKKFINVLSGVLRYYVCRNCDEYDRSRGKKQKITFFGGTRYSEWYSI